MQLDSLYRENVRNVVFIHDDDSNNPDTLHIRHLTGDGPRDIKLSDEINRLQLDEANAKNLVRRVLNSTLEEWAIPEAKQVFYGSMWGSALIAARAYLPEDRLLQKKLVLATIVYHGGHSKYENNFISAILPNRSRESTMQDVINYLLEVGCTEEEIRTAWAEMLQARLKDNFTASYIVDWWRGLKVGEKSFMAEAEPVARQLLLRKMKDVLVDGCCDWNNMQSDGNARAPEGLMRLIDFLLSQTGYEWQAKNDEVRNLIESHFVYCLARGKAGAAFYMFIRYGESFGLWRESARYNFHPEKTANAAVQRLMRAAVPAAEKAHNYGIGAAIAEHLGDTAEADRLRDLARVLNQRVTLDFMFYHAIDQDK